MNPHPRRSTLALTALLVACGGGGDAGTPAPAPVPTGGVTLTGVVAKGAALAGATVTAQCASGAGTAVAGADGRYTLSIATGTLPCVLAGAAADGSLTLHSVGTSAAVDGSGAATVNITSLTELLVARVVGTEPAAYFADSSRLASIATTITPSAVAAGQTAVVNTLQAAGLDTSALTNLVSQPLVAAVGGTGGNAYDQVLDRLNSSLGVAGTTLAELSRSVAAASPAAAPPAGSGTTETPSGLTGPTASLPAELLLSPKAPNCAALRSTRYQLFRLAPSNRTDGSISTLDTVTLDAPTLTFTSTTNPADTWSWAGITNGNCRYTAADGTDIVVSPAGVIVARAVLGADDDSVPASVRGTPRMVVGIPQQDVAVSDLAGVWNSLAFEDVDATGNLVPVAGTFEIASGGAVTRASCFEDALLTGESACTTNTTLLPRFERGSGGLSLVSTDPAEPGADRAVAYRAGNGDLMMALLNSSGEAFFATRYRTLRLPAVGEVSQGWNVQITLQGLASPALSATRNEILTVDAASGVTTRRSTTVGLNDGHTQTVTRNSPRPGYSQRLAATGVVQADGNTRTVRPFVSLGLRGMGVSAVVLPNTLSSGSNASFLLSVDQP